MARFDARDPKVDMTDEQHGIADAVKDQQWSPRVCRIVYDGLADEYDWCLAHSGTTRFRRIKDQDRAYARAYCLEIARQDGYRVGWAGPHATPTVPERFAKNGRAFSDAWLEGWSSGSQDAYQELAYQAHQELEAWRTD